MSKEMYTVDLHCHPNLKSFNSGHPKPKFDMWENIRHNITGQFAKLISDSSKHVLKESQTNLHSLAAGDVRVFNVSLYPIERGFLHFRDVPKWLIGRNRVNIMHEVITGFDASRIMHLKKHDEYYQDLIDEYKFVYKAQGKSPDGKKHFLLVNNYAELTEALKDADALIGIISIEGGHVLGASSVAALKKSNDELTEVLTNNIAEIKNWEFPPFTINLGHHFWNNLCGHAASFKPPINSIVNQNKGKNKGITELGWHAIRQLLSRENGKRILIDVKHMSVASRKEYYNFIVNYNLINPADKIPVICSHCAVNGFNTMDSSIKETDIASKSRGHRFHRWSINLSNEEIRIIHQSEGLIGLMMDRGILGGTQTIQRIVAVTDPVKQRREYCKLFWDNIFQIVKAVGDETGWDIIAYGSDFDGTITHMEPYESSTRLPLFREDLINYLEETEDNKDLWYGNKPSELVQKVMYKNAMRFYKKFFV